MKGDRALKEEDAVAAVRDYFEHELQEAGSRLREPHRPAHRTRSVPRGFASIAVLGVVAIVVATAMRVVVLAPGSSTPPSASLVASPLPSESGTSSNPSSSPTSAPVAGDLPGSVSLSGSSAWMLLDSGLSVSDDAGRTWATVPLPSSVASAAVAAVTTAPSRPIWLAVKSGDGYLLYRKVDAAASWSSVLLTPSWALLPSDQGIQGPADMVRITPGPRDSNGRSNDERWLNVRSHLPLRIDR
jgi:hypothetical protein